MSDSFAPARRPGPRFPRQGPLTRVYWNWEVTYECNYQCSYCYFWKEERYRQAYPSVPTVRWRQIWEAIFEDYGCGHIRFSGGEPFVYPDFIGLVSALAELHTVDVTTNLAFDVQRFLREVEPGGVTLSASFHPEFVALRDFLDSVRLLQERGFPTSIAYVAYPPHLADLERYKSEAEKCTLFKIIPFHGEFEGKKYPAGYSPEQKKLLEGAAANTTNPSQKEINTQFLDRGASQKGPSTEKSCHMGELYARILPSGEVTRCCHPDSGKLGSIFSPDLRLLDAPAPCAVEACPCWKAMIVGRSEDKYSILWEMPKPKKGGCPAPQF